ncbi:MAG: DeoR family transcriptional regulator [Clostridia bacterium]|nr:DeoR family transcriptional regulator [Clostridia bacterium]
MKSTRLKQIKQILIKEGKVVNTDLCERFSVSMATVRRDLDMLEAEGVIHRIYGGALPAQTDKSGDDISRWERRRQEGLTQKEAIALRAEEAIPDNCTVYLDSSKIEKSADVTTCSTSEIHTLITDDGASKLVLDAVQEQGVRVTVAKCK